MKVEPFGPDEYGNPGGWRIEAWSSIDELLRFRDEQRLRVTQNQLLFVLDDAGQAVYTSGHARNALGLTTPEQERLSPEEHELYQQELKLSPERWTETVTLNLQRLVEQTGPLNSPRGLAAIGDPEIDLLRLYRNLDEVFETPLTCLTIKSDAPSMAIAAHPNGYFSGDLTPGENYLLAERLRLQFGFEILGLGSYLAAYVRPEPLDERGMAAVIASVAHLYDDMTDTVAKQWAEAAADKRWFILHYRGS